MTAPTVNLPRGGQRAAENKAQEKSARGSVSSRDWEYLTLEAPEPGKVEGGTIVIRFITDEPDWIEVKQHGFVNTKPAPADIPEGKNWPKKMGAVCRKSRGFEDAYPQGCYICENYPNQKGTGPHYAGLKLWALAVEREEIEGTAAMADEGLIEKWEVGDIVGYRDVEVEKPVFKDGKETGETRKTKRFLVLNFGLDNFFNQFLGYKTAYKTVVSRDFKITRQGSGTDTNYIAAPLDEIINDGVKYDLRNPEIAKLYENDIDLQAIVLDQASDRHYHRWFDTSVETNWSTKKPAEDSTESAPAAKVEKAEEPSTEALDAVRERLLSSKNKK